MKFIEKSSDRWHTITGDDGPMVTLTPKPYSLLTLLQWHGIRQQWPQDMPVGVIASNEIDIEDLTDDLPRLALVALQFPKWVDGRAYSQAHTLRSRLRYTGEVRAVGEVLVDMLSLLQRCGFDAVELRGDQSREAAERALSFFPGHYQGDVRETRPIFVRPAGDNREPEFLQGGASI